MHNFIEEKLGVKLPEFELDGKYKHFASDNSKKKHLWAIGSEVIYNGESLKCISFGDFRTGEKFFYHSKIKSDVTKQEKALIKKERDYQRKIAKIEAEKKHESFYEKWLSIYKDSKHINEHEYFTKKKLYNNKIPKIVKKYKSSILIPMFNDKKLTGVQLIWHDQQSDSFKKVFISGSKLQGSFFPFGDFVKSETLYFAEGFATAMTIYQLTNQPTICCFNANNITMSINTVRKINHNCNIIICADNDHELKNGNIGIEKAKLASEKLSNVTYIYPDFVNPSGNTDFNDLYCQEGPTETKKQINKKKSTKNNFTKILPMGQFEGKFYYFNTRTKVLTALTPDQHKKHYFLSMAISTYWGDNYRYKTDKDGELTSTPDWDFIADEIFEQSRKVGFFNPKSMRGIGAWMDHGNIVYNTGSNLIINYEKVDILKNDFKTEFFYESKMPIEINKVENYEYGDRLKDVFKKLKFAKEQEHVYLVSWIAQSFIFGALDWRFHVWLTGQHGTGKSQILSFINDLTHSCYVEDSSAAGIRQRIKSDAIPVIYDESEANDNKITDVISMARQCSSNTSTERLRGTPSGKSIIFNTNSVFLLGSIQVCQLNPADSSRFFEIELNDTKNQSAVEYQEICDEIYDLSQTKNELRDYLIYNLKNIRLSIKSVKKYLLNEYELSKRECDQLATPMALYHHISIRQKINNDQIASLYKYLNFNNDDVQKDDYSEQCFAEILNIQLDQDFTIYDAIKHIYSINFESDETIRKISSVGIIYDKTKKEIYFSQNSKMKKMLSNNTDFINYMQLLKRNKRHLRPERKYLNGVQKRFKVLSFNPLHP